jgi:SNF2 family DNA or RNA helicase
MDESTRIKNPSANRTKSVLKLTSVSKYRRILTGNEVTKTPFEVYSQFKFLKDDFWDMSYHVFKNRYAEFITQYGQVKKLRAFTNCTTCQRRHIQPVVKGFFNRKTDGWDVKFYCPKCDHRLIFKTGTNDYVTREALKVKKSQGRYPYKKLTKFKKLDELKAKIAPFSYRVRKSDALPDLPAKIFSPIYTELNEEQEQLYAQLKVELFAEYKDDIVEIPNKIALMMRFQQITGGFFPGEEQNILIGKSSPKMDRLLYDLEDVDDEAIIIWSVFVPEIEHIAKVLKEKYPDDNLAMFYGGVKKKDRPEIITEFQKGNIRFLIANPSVGGTGLNLQRSTLHYYYSNGTKAEDRWQSEDRSHRSGQENHVVYKDIIIPKTVDESIQKILTDNKTLSEFFKQPLENII